MVDHGRAGRRGAIRAPAADLGRSAARPAAVPITRLQRGLAIYLLGLFLTFGIFLFTAQYLQLVLGLSPLAAGLWPVPETAALIVGSMLTPPLARRAQPGVVVAAGLVLSAAGLGLLTHLDGVSGLALLVTGMVVFSLGLAPLGTLATDLIVGTAAPERAGSAAGISETGAELGGALGIAVLGSIGTAIYRSQVVEAAPAGIPSQAVAASRDTLGGAVTAAGQLPDQLGTARLGTVRPTDQPDPSPGSGQDDPASRSSH